MRTCQKDLIEKFLLFSNQIKISKRPFFITYKPHSFALKGHHTREIIKIVRPGDILVRTHNNYLNHYLLPGTFTHVGFYLGPVSENHLKQLAKIENPTTFHTGEQMVIHAIGTQLYLEHLIDFCRCDGLAIMRFPSVISPNRGYSAPEELQAYFKNPMPTPEPQPEETMDNDNVKKTKKTKLEEAAPIPAKLDAVSLALIKAERDITYHLTQGKNIEFEKVFKVFYRVALKELSTPYSYDFGFDNFSATACAEFIYFVTKSICWNYDITPQPKKLLFKQRRVVEPDTFVNGELEEIWKEIG